MQYSDVVPYELLKEYAQAAWNNQGQLDMQRANEVAMNYGFKVVLRKEILTERMGYYGIRI